MPKLAQSDDLRQLQGHTLIHQRHTFRESPGSTSIREVDVVLASDSAWDAWPERLLRAWSSRPIGHGLKLYVSLE